jgi:hypothetical protein
VAAPVSADSTEANEEAPMPVNFQICIDCADPPRLAEFWANALGVN